MLTLPSVTLLIDCSGKLMFCWFFPLKGNCYLKLLAISSIIGKVYLEKSSKTWANTPLFHLNVCYYASTRSIVVKRGGRIVIITNPRGSTAISSALNITKAAVRFVAFAFLVSGRKEKKKFSKMNPYPRCANYHTVTLKSPGHSDFNQAYIWKITFYIVMTFIVDGNSTDCHLTVW